MQIYPRIEEKAIFWSKAYPTTFCKPAESAGYYFFPISEFSYKILTFLLNSSMVKSDNEIGKFIKIWYVPGGLAHQGQCELIF